VLKESDNNYVIDLYCSKYPKQFSERIDKPFLTELKNIKDGVIKYSDVVDFKELSFITSNAWGVDDWFRFSFIDFEFYGVIEYDGSYILRFGCKSNIFMENILDKIFSASAEKKYEAKEAKKNNTIDFNVLIKNEDNPFSDDIILQNLENVKFSVDNNVK
jgi:hypothetical protein